MFGRVEGQYTTKRREFEHAFHVDADQLFRPYATVTHPTEVILKTEKIMNISQ